MMNSFQKMDAFDEVKRADATSTLAISGPISSTLAISGPISQETVMANNVPPEALRHFV
jgi:hypothetical protein